MFVYRFMYMGSTGVLVFNKPNVIHVEALLQKLLNLYQPLKYTNVLS